MGYRELVRRWNEGVLALEKGDGERALNVFRSVATPTSKIDFNIGSLHLQALDRTVSKDNCLAVGFFQRGYVCLRLERYEEALNDCRLALTHLRKNPCIDYKQLGLKFVLCTWEVLYNTAAAQCRLGRWQDARRTLEEAAGQSHKGPIPQLNTALEQVQEHLFLEPRSVPVGEIFRPPTKDVEELEEKDFLGQPKVTAVISSAFLEDKLSASRGLQTQVHSARREASHLDSRPILLKVHGSYTVDMKVGAAPSLADLTTLLQEECRRQAAQMTLRYRPPGHDELIPINNDEELKTVWQEVQEGRLTLWCQGKEESVNRPVLYRMVAHHPYGGQAQVDLHFKEGDKLEVLSEVNTEWLEGRCNGAVGIFPKCFAVEESANATYL
ncbi:NADPH oxidase activator 1 [Elgaria multicarinata webbii]|uniref:NADPH oxidase activator 1 n=1 Tax=Elgaria multicarinata webbii TaxID=159646 RepID=UPI002FCD46EC